MRRLLPALALPLLAAACEQTDGWIDRRKRAFEGVAAVVNGPLAALEPFHQRISASGSGDVVLLDAILETCREAAPKVAELERLALPPDEQGRPFESAEAVQRAATRYRESIESCRAGAASPRPAAVCALECTHRWGALTRAVERLRVDANWVQIRVQHIAPPPPEKRR